LAEARVAVAFLEAYWAPATSPTPRPGLQDSGPGVTLAMAGELRAMIASAGALHTELRAAALARMDRAPVERGRVLLRTLRRLLAFVLASDLGGDERGARQLLAVRRAHPEQARSPTLVAKQLHAFASLANVHRARLKAVRAFDVALIDEAVLLADALRVIRRPSRRPELAFQRAERDRLLREIWTRVLAIRAAARFVFMDHPQLARLPGSKRARTEKAAQRRAAREAKKSAETAETATPAKAPARRRRSRAKKPPAGDTGDDGE
jgi:hypothetical protein